MTRSLRSPAHLALMQALRRTRHACGLTQDELARRLDRPQSFVAKIEGGERRLDVVEFAEVVTALGVEPATLLDPVLAMLSSGSASEDGRSS